MSVFLHHIMNRDSCLLWHGMAPWHGVRTTHLVSSAHLALGCPAVCPG